MADLTPETLAAWGESAETRQFRSRAERAEKRVDVECRLRDEYKARAEKAEAALALALNQQVEAERKYADLVAALRPLIERGNGTDLKNLRRALIRGEL